MVACCSVPGSGFQSGVLGCRVEEKMVPAVGIEPTRSQAPRDFECENGIFSNPLILARFSRNSAKIMGNLISIYSSLFYLFQSFSVISITILAQSVSSHPLKDVTHFFTSF
jgi:hypothetical protein